MDKLAIFRRMLDPKNWPVKQGDYLIHEGEIYAFIADGNPEQECIYKPLYR